MYDLPTFPFLVLGFRVHAIIPSPHWSYNTSFSSWLSWTGADTQNWWWGVGSAFSVPTADVQESLWRKLSVGLRDGSGGKPQTT